MTPPDFFHNTVFYNAFPRSFSGEEQLPLPGINLTHSKIKEVCFVDDWNQTKNLLENSEHHQGPLTKKELEDLSGNETTLKITLEPINPSNPNFTFMENISRYIRHAIVLAWRLDLESSGYVGLDILSDSNGNIWSTGSRSPIHYPYPSYNKGLTSKSLENIKDLYPIFIGEMKKYWDTLRKDIEEDNPAQSGLQVRNRFIKALRWYDMGDLDPVDQMFPLLSESMSRPT